MAVLSSIIRACSIAWLFLFATTSGHQQPQSYVNEPLLRFPFIEFIADPCGLMPSMFKIADNGTTNTSSSQSQEPMMKSIRKSLKFPLRKLSFVETPLSQQAALFLNPVSEYYTNHKFTLEERKVFMEEFYLVLQEAKYRTNHMFPLSTTYICDSIQLKSLFSNVPFRFSTGQTDIKEIYRSLAILSAHLHLEIRDISDSSRCYPTEKRAHRQNMRVLTGKVETLMCLTWTFAAGKETPNFLEVIRDVLQINMQRYYECSAREIRRCLVSRYAHRTFDAIQHLVNNELIFSFKW